MSKASCRLCRRANTKLFLKGERCQSAKCPFTKRAYAPGQHGQMRGARPSDYALQLQEKQKTKHIYHLREKQFKNYYLKAAKQRAVTGEILLQILERRLDNVVYRLGFAPSRKAARQIVNHGHVLVNNKKVTICSYQVKSKDQISLKNKNIKPQKTEIPVWLSLDKNKILGLVEKNPVLEDIASELDTQLIVEFYSR